VSNKRYIDIQSQFADLIAATWTSHFLSFLPACLLLLLLLLLWLLLVRLSISVRGGRHLGCSWWERREGRGKEREGGRELVCY